MRASSERSAAGAAGNHKEFPQFYSGHFTLNIPSESSQRRVNPGYRTLKSHAHRITNGSNRCIGARQGRKLDGADSMTASEKPRKINLEIGGTTRMSLTGVRRAKAALSSG
jgi:hypothetical protein